MGRRRRRVIRIVKKKLPTVFVCPRCGEEAVRVTIAKDTGKATVICALCQLKDEFPAHPAAQMIDVYSYFADRFYGVKDPRAIIPHERELSHVPLAEEEPSEPEAESLIQPTIDALTPEENERVTSNEQEPQRLEKEESAGLPEPTPPVEATSEKPSETIVAPEQQEAISRDEPTLGEDNEPFADILGHKDEDKDKKRYSSNPLPQQQSEQTSQATD